MTPSFENVQRLLKQLPGLGYRSAERIALNLLVEKPERLKPLLNALTEASESVKRCVICGNLSEGELCAICSNNNRRKEEVCVVESIPDLYAIERSNSYQGTYHVLHGKLSPIRGVGVSELNLNVLENRLKSDQVEEIILALDNDIESEATCHYMQKAIIGEMPIKVSRIGFGLPSGGGVLYADSATLKNALESRKEVGVS